MALSNPTVNPPRLPKPGDSHAHPHPASRSQSRSPIRHARNFSQDPILRNLSPSSTLRALNAGPGASNGKSEDRLLNSVDRASPSQRAFGIRVAQTCKDLRAWAVEVESWEWPGSFETPPEADRAAVRIHMLTAYGLDPEKASAGSSESELAARNHNFWGSLPKEIVQGYESRIEDITSAVEELHVEELKDHVRKVHQRTDSSGRRPSDRNILNQLQHMDDFTALITATILQALPYLSWLNRLVTEWNLRLTVIRKVPGFLRGLSTAKTSLEEAWDEITIESQRNEEVAGPLYNRFNAMRAGMSAKVATLGQRLDSMLDDLEGRPETLPDHWIDQFEALEAAYSEWVVQSEKLIMGLAWKRSQAVTKTTPDHKQNPWRVAGMSKQFGLLKESTSEYAVSPMMEGKFDFGFSSTSNQENEAPPSPMVPPPRNESPVLGLRPVALASHTTLEDTLRARQDSIQPQMDRDYVKLVDDVIAESQDQSALAHPEMQSAPHELPADIAFRHAVNAPIPASPARASPSKVFQASPQRGSPPRLRTRHTPINVDAYRDAIEPGPRSSEASDAAFSFNREPPLPPLSEGSTPLERPVSDSQESPSKIRKLTKSQDQPSGFARLFHARSKSGSLHRASLQNASNTPRSSVSSSKRSSGTTTYGALISTGPRQRLSRSSASDAPTALPPPTRSSRDDPRPFTRPVLLQRKSDRSDGGISLRRSKSNGRRRAVSDLSSPVVSPMEASPPPLGMRKVDEEIFSPQMSMDANSFEAMFVDSLPDALNQQIFDLSFPESTTLDKPFDFNPRRPNGSREPSFDPSMLDGVLNHTLEKLKAGNTASPKRRSSRTSGSARFSGMSNDFIESISEVGTPSPSAESTPEVRDAFSAGYFQPREVQTAPSPSKLNPNHRRASIGRRGSRKRASDPVIHELPGEEVFPCQESSTDDQMAKRKSMEKRASIASIENFPRSKLKTVDIQRQPSINEGNDPVKAYEKARDNMMLDRLREMRSEPNSPSRADFGDLPARSASFRDSLAPPAKALRTDSERSVVAHNLGAPKPMPLDLEVPKRRRSEQLEDPHSQQQTPGADPVKTPAKSGKRRDSISSASGDNFDRHVSDVLRSMPSQIRFTPNPARSNDRPLSPTHAHTPQPASGRKSALPKPSRPTRPGPTLTLAPANPTDASPKKSSSEDMKLYHLSAPGRSEPMKLFIRLVGEKERVMVRVGGGWMDLLDFLQQYAQHHSTRTVSAGSTKMVEVKEAEKVGSARKERTALSRPGSTLDYYSSPTVGSAGVSPVGGRGGVEADETTKQRRDDERDSKSEKRKDAPPTTSPSIPIPVYKTPEMSNEPFPFTDTPGKSPSMTPNYTHHGRSAEQQPPAKQSQGQTPRSLPSKTEASRPGTADGAAGHKSRPGSSGLGSTPTSTNGAVGLGLSGKKAGSEGKGLDSEKTKWVEEMVIRAKMASSEKKGGPGANGQVGAGNGMGNGRASPAIGGEGGSVFPFQQR